MRKYFFDLQHRDPKNKKNEHIIVVFPRFRVLFSRVFFWLIDKPSCMHLFCLPVCTCVFLVDREAFVYSFVLSSCVHDPLPFWFNQFWIWKPCSTSLGMKLPHSAYFRFIARQSIGNAGDLFRRSSLSLSYASQFFELWRKRCWANLPK